MRSIVSVSPFKCRMWALHDRLDAQINETTCRAEIESFAVHGQLVPALGRPLRNDPDHNVELIYGARRLFVSRHLNKPLLVELRDMTDREGIIAMHIENKQRTDISPYERGLSYVRWMQSGYLKSQDDIARALRMSASQVSRLLKLARLPTVVVEAFGGPQDIRECWGGELVDALDDPLRRQHTLQKARAICAAGVRQQAKDVYRQLLAASLSGRKIKVKSHDEVVNGRNGEQLFRIRYCSRSVALMLGTEKVTAPALKLIREAVADILQPAEARVAVRVVNNSSRTSSLAASGESGR
jgi:ParB family chromosome partitioning protein